MTDKRYASDGRLMTIDELREYGAMHDKRSRWRVKLKVINHYGKVCACCGEDKVEFLAIDHINGRGNQERQKLGLKAGIAFYRWLIRNNYPLGYRVLCHNCNCSIGYYGYCPHHPEIRVNGGVTDLASREIRRSLQMNLELFA